METLHTIKQVRNSGKEEKLHQYFEDTELVLIAVVRVYLQCIRLDKYISYYYFSIKRNKGVLSLTMPEWKNI